MAEITEGQKPIKGSENEYEKMGSIVKSILEEMQRKGNLTFWGNITPENMKNYLEKYAPQIREAFTQQYRQQVSNLSAKLNTSEGENLNLRTTNTEQKEKISGIETNLSKVQAEYATIKKGLLDLFSVEELESEAYRREEKSIIQAEDEDSMKEMGFKEAEET